MPSIDPGVRDSRLAAIIFSVCFIGLLAGASLGLNLWPAQAFFMAAQGTSARDFFFAFQAFALVLVLLFWCSAPRPRERRLVLLGWLATIFALYIAVPETRPVFEPKLNLPSLVLFLAGTLAIPSLLAILVRIFGPHRDRDVATQRFRWLVGLTLLFILVPQPALSLTAAVHPYTFDAFALHFDRIAGLAWTPWIIHAVNRLPGLSQLVELAYGATPLVFLSVPLLQLRGSPRHVPSALLTWVVLSAGAMAAYHFFPITGPKYVYGSEKFLAALIDGANQPLRLAQVDIYPRNGMPSMHFGWLLAASILWWQMGTRAWSRAVMLLLTALTAIATLYTGEHYTIDLIVAVPFVLSALALCTTGVSWRSVARRGTVALGVGCWLTWVLLLRHQMALFVEEPWTCQLLLLATALVVVQQVRWMRQFKREARELGQDAAPAPVAREQRLWQFRFGAMFFASGAAALVYQVLFAKELALVFGSTATATFTVLATFLGGMAIGSLIGGELAHRSKKPLITYALMEVGIAVYCVITPQLFKLIQSGYVQLAADTPADAPSLLVLRVVLGAAVLLVPTVLMGTTLPLLAQALGPAAGRMGSRVARLYFANTAGAALGALLTAYFVIPALGAHRTTLVAAMLNLLVALGALELAKHKTADAGQAPGAAVATPQRDWPQAARWAALAALGLGGVLSLGLEVVYVHMLSIVAGNSVYAFGLMVATFLLGLSLGGEAARRLLLRPHLNTAFALVLSLLGLCLSVVAGAATWNAIPEYFASYANFPLVRSFGSREAVRGLVCALVMVPPTIFIGTSYVLAMDIFTASSVRPKTRLLGWGSAVNTAGNISGVLLFGFVLLPALGGLAASLWIAGGAVLLALGVLLAAARTQLWRGASAVAVAALAVLAGTNLKLDYATLSSGANVYFYPQAWGEIIDQAQSIDGGLTTVATSGRNDAKPVHTLLTNGKFQGNDAPRGEVQAQVGFALAPLLHQDRRGAALVIGYGTGVTSRVFHEAGFASLEIAELSGDIVRLANRHFGAVNLLVTQQPGVKLHVTDGRNLLLLSPPAKYDVVSIEISSIWFAGAASLYNREFYSLARSRMTEHGVLQQWLQMHRLTPVHVLHVIATLRSEFAYVSLYLIGGQGILVATNDASRAAASAVAMAKLEATPQLARVRAIIDRDLASLQGDLLVGAAGVDRFLNEYDIGGVSWLSTDDNLVLEYSTPRANVNDGEKTFKANRTLLVGFR